MTRRKTNFDQSALMNNAAYLEYYNQLKELAMTIFEWHNLPLSINKRFLEKTLFDQGKIAVFKDDVMGLVCLPVDNDGGTLDIYGEPISFVARANNGYYRQLDQTTGVIIYNSYARNSMATRLMSYAYRLANLDRIMDVNANAQKTPVVVQCTESQRLSLKNLYKEVDGNSPVIYADKGLDLRGLTVLHTDAPYVCDRLYTLKTQLWNEALTYIGIDNNNSLKKERLITAEVDSESGAVVSSRFSRLSARQDACAAINKLFDLDVSCEFRNTADDLSEGGDEIE